MTLTGNSDSRSSDAARLRCAVPVTLRRRGTDLELLTSEVTFKDAFVRTSSPPPVNSLVRLVFTLPPDDAKIALSAHVTEVVSDGSHGHYPGFVARFVGLDGPAKDRWEALVQSVRGEGMGAADTTVVYAPLSYVDLFQSRGPAAGDVWLRPASVEELERIVRDDIPTGSVVIPDAAAVTPGANVRVQLLHPVTQSVFALDGVVRRPKTGAGAGNGITVGIAPLTPERTVELTEMAESVVVLEDYDIELYDEPVYSRP